MSTRPRAGLAQPASDRVRTPVQRSRGVPGGGGIHRAGNAALDGSNVRTDSPRVGMSRRSP